ncbi:MAG: J domain-containing protein [Acidobacteriota bacterium]|nr:J domain-containing protein [Blastocatellia bacterium]MDW8238802.1 J domain-containing protein [Acidobacteriota bacterium]
MKISVTQTEAGLQVRLYSDSAHFAVALETMKSHIPRHHRRFDAAQRCWMIDPQGQGRLESWLSWMRRELKAEVVYRSPHHRSDSLDQRSSLTPAYATLHLLPTAPPELVKAAYHCLARINHPDVGGDTKSMQQINIAYAHIKQHGMNPDRTTSR